MENNNSTKRKQFKHVVVNPKTEDLMKETYRDSIKGLIEEMKTKAKASLKKKEKGEEDEGCSTHDDKIEEAKKDDSYLETDMSKRQKNNEKAISDMKKTKAHRDMVKAASKHFEETEYVEESSEERKELRKLAAQERAAEKKHEREWRSTSKPGEKKTGPKYSTTKLPKRDGADYAEKTLRSAHAIDKLTRGKTLHGMSEESEQVSERYYGRYKTYSGHYKDRDEPGEEDWRPDVKAHNYALKKKKATIKKDSEKKDQNEEFDLEEGMTMKDFKKKRSAQKQKEKRADAKISPLRRAGIHDDKASPERAARHRANVDPDFEGNDERNYPGGKLKSFKKMRKAKATGELTTEGKVSWNDPKNPNPSGYTPKEKSEAKRKQLGVDNPDTQSFEKGGPGEKEYARHGNLSAAQKKMERGGQQPKGKPHQFRKDPFWKKTQGQVKRTMFGTDVPKSKESSYPSSVVKAKS